MLGEKGLKESYKRLYKENLDLLSVNNSLSRQLEQVNESVSRLVGENQKYCGRINEYKKELQLLREIVAQLESGEKLDRIDAYRKVYYSGSAARRAYVRSRFGSGSFPDEYERKKESGRKFKDNIKFSFLIPLYNTPIKYLKELLALVEQQTYENWELCLLDASDVAHSGVGDVAREFAEKIGDGKVKYRHSDINAGISGNTNLCAEMATGDYFCLLDHDDLIHPSILYKYAEAIENTSAEVLYCDEIVFSGDDLGNVKSFHVKPDFSIDYLRTNNYFCHMLCFKAKLMTGERLFNSEYDGAQDYDLVLRLTERTEHITHVRQVLYYWRAHPGSTAMDTSQKSYASDAGRRALEAHIKRKGFDARVSFAEEGGTIYRVQYIPEGEPSVTIIIPNKNHSELLKKCVDSIFVKSSYRNIRIFIVENGSYDDSVFQTYEQLKNGPWGDRIQVVSYTQDAGESFNFSKLCNFAAKSAKGEYLLFLNNDVEVITTDWLQEMLSFAQREDVGAVGAMLYYPDDRVQHAGIIMGVRDVCDHMMKLRGRDEMGFGGRLICTQNLCAVTGACLMVSRRKFEDIGGFDINLPTDYNDVDLCLRLREKGYQNVFTPHAKLYHYESVSRVKISSGANEGELLGAREYFVNRWRELLREPDPYYNPLFTRNNADFEIFLPDDYDGGAGFELEEYSPGQKISFQASDYNADRFVIKGTDRSEGDFAWTLGNCMLVLLKLEGSKHTSLSVNLSIGGTITETQRVRFSCGPDSDPVEEKLVHSGDSEVSFSIKNASQELMLMFEFPDAVAPIELGINNDERLLGIQLKSMRIE